MIMKSYGHVHLRRAHTCGNPFGFAAVGSNWMARPCWSADGIFLLSTTGSDGLMYEPRGHEVMSGSILYEPTR